MKNRIYNFSAGPATMPLPVLEKAQSELLSLRGIGMSVMEISHRSMQFEAILAGAENGLRELLSVPDNFRILFSQGGASLQFSMVPLNYLSADQTADYVITGFWGRKALTEANRCGNINVIYSTADSGYSTLPDQGELNFSPDAQYIHYVANETIEGVEFKYEIDGGGIPIICDMSSNIMSRPIDFDKYAVIYTGAQKNIGPSGLAVIFVREDMLEKSPRDLHSLLNYRTIAENGSMANTPNTWAIYMVGLVCEWLKNEGGVVAIQLKNQEKAAILYKAIDSSDGYYTGHADLMVRSMMNVTFRLPTADLDEQFCADAALLGLDGLRGHRSLGGVRASIYNAFPREGVLALVEFMQDFAQRHG
ncbi:MAG: 3-phosphoserine/phosphohydroxythreonine transaminase [Pyrinomonadaceae bacterium]